MNNEKQNTGMFSSNSMPIYKILLLLLVTTVISIIAMVFYTFNTLDQIEKKNLQERISIAFDVEKERLNDLLQEYSYWNEAHQNLIVSPNLKWVENNTGLYLYETYDIAFSIAFKGNMESTVQILEGHPNKVDIKTMLKNGLSEFLKNKLHYADDKSINNVYFEYSKDVYMISISNFFDEETELVKPDGSFIVIAKKINQKFIADIADTYKLPKLYLGNLKNDDTASSYLTINDPFGNQLSRITWVDVKPSDVMSSIVIFIIITTFIFIILARFILINEGNNRNRYEKILKDTVDTRTHELLVAKEEAERASLAKSEFLSSMSHELRTPLNAIIGFSEILEMDEKDDEKKQHIQIVIKAGHHLLELINQVLDLEKIESDRIEISIRSHSLHKILNGSLSVVKPLSDKHHIKIDNKVSSLTDVNIKVDDVRFKQVLLNILSNAIKYNSENGKVTIDYSLNDKSMFCLSVTDTGKGFTDEQVSKLFIPFERFGAANSHIEGTGLGLVIAKELIEKMAGTITVESERGKGSQFIIQVPLS